MEIYNIPISLSKKVRLELGQELSDQYEAWKKHKSQLEPRWDRLEKFMRNEPEMPAELPWEGAVFRNIPVLSSKAQAWLAYVSVSPTQAMPYLVGTIFGSAASRANDIESDFYLFMRAARWHRYFRRNVYNVGLYGKAVWRVRVGLVNGRPLFQYDACRPRSIVAYPNVEEGIEAMVQIGHEYEIRYSQVKELQESKKFYQDDERPISSPTQRKNQDAPGKMDETKSIATKEADRPVSCVECLAKLKLEGDAEEKWYQVRYVPDDKALLAVYPYPYSRPWYFDMYVHEEQGRWWPETSRFNALQDIQLATNDQWNQMQWGGQMAANPTQFAVGWALPQKYAKTKPGQVVPILQGGSVMGIQSRYDPSVGPMLLQDLDRRADMMMRIGSQQQSTSNKYDQTATGAQIREAAKEAAIEDDLAYMDVCMGEIGAFQQELYQYHYPLFAEAYGEALTVLDPTVLDAPIQWELLGKTPSATPQAQANAAIGLGQTLLSFQPQIVALMEAAGVNVGELIRTIVSNSAVENRSAILNPDQGAGNAADELGGELGVPGGAVPMPGMGMGQEPVAPGY